PCRRHRVPIVERLGRLRGLCIRDAGRMVQSLRATARAIARRARPNGEIASRTACPGRSVIDMNDGAVRMSCDAQLAEGGGKIIKLGYRAEEEHDEPTCHDHYVAAVCGNGSASE